MQQIVQKLKTGRMRIIEAPLPSLQAGCLLVRSHYSLISAGTETSTVKTARKGYIGKAKERPEQVKQIVDVLKSQGPVQTYRAVMKKLDSYSPLGYSCAGEVIAVESDVVGLGVGDLVACGGLTASHAEVVAVPKNLCVKLKSDADLKQAAYNTLGAIALQGVRQAELRLGESCAIIGLGLLGQITGLLLRAAGVRVIGVDINPAMVTLAAKHSVDLALMRNTAGIKERILGLTGGLGCDSVIITAATDSLDPINFAGAIARKRGTIVVVGVVPAGFDREPHFYKKELQVRMSCSYGPGRYDSIYEDKGVDYPPAYVRWTENRNMQAFQDLIYTKKIDVSYLTTHTFELDKAPAAYDMMVAKSEPFIGILIEYDATKEINRYKSKVELKGELSAISYQPSAVNIGFIGAGSYAQGNLLPNIPKNSAVSLKGVLTSSGTSSRSVAERFGFEFCTSDEKDLIHNEDVNTIFIATRHDTHAEYVMKALEAGKHVFVEKPLCLTEKELGQIVELMSGHRPANSISSDADEPMNESTNQLFDTTETNRPILMVGYNRRFSPLTQTIKKAFGEGPMAMIYRVNAGIIPADSWIQDREIGGGRIIGEVCHFVDYLAYVNGSLPESVFASTMRDPKGLEDVVNISLRFKNGSIGTICYFSNGDKALPKELVEIYANGSTAVLKDFRALTIYDQGKKKEKKLLFQDKGQKNEVVRFVDAVLNGKGEVIPFQDLYTASLTTFKIIESIRTGSCLKIGT